MLIKFPPRHRQLHQPTFARETSDPAVNDESCCFGSNKPKNLCQRVNVEPVIFLFAIAFGLITTVQPLFLYWARCIEIFTHYKNFTALSVHNVSDLCAHLSYENNTVYEDIVEKDISTTKIFLQIANGVPTLLTVPIIGAWSDGSGGRRRPLLLSLFGLFIYTLLQLGSTLSYKWIGVYHVLYVAEIFIGFTGGIASLFMTSFAIVTDDCRHEMLPGMSSVPLRIGITSALQSVGLVVGNLIASFFAVSPLISVREHENGYIRAVAVEFVLAFIAMFYAFVCVRETHRNLPPQFRGRESVSHQTICASSLGETPAGTGSRSCRKFMKSFVYDIVEVLVEPRPGWTRFCLNISICFFFVDLLAADNQLLLLLVKRYPFDWSDTMFTYFSLLKNVASSLGMILFPIVISKTSCLGKDSLLIMVGVLASCVQSTLFSFANNSALIFIAGGFSFLAGAIAPAYRSFLPRMVAKEETARLFTAFSIVLIFCPILSAVLFNNTFNATMDAWPGFAFLVGASFQMIVFIGQIVIHRLMWPMWSSEHEQRVQRLETNEADDELSDGQQSPVASDIDATTSTVSRSLSNVSIHCANNSPETSDDMNRRLLV
uniref:Proton-coupled folate transporter n=1 Tax=Parascaris univalens TaxID=6257 RepID=A0A914ZJ79_PARUN